MDADPTLADRQPVGPDLALAIQLEHRATQNAIVRSYGIMPSHTTRGRYVHERCL